MREKNPLELLAGDAAQFLTENCVSNNSLCLQQQYLFEFLQHPGDFLFAKSYLITAKITICWERKEVWREKGLRRGNFKYFCANYSCFVAQNVPPQYISEVQTSSDEIMKMKIYFRSPNHSRPWKRLAITSTAINHQTRKIFYDMRPIAYKGENMTAVA